MSTMPGADIVPWQDDELLRDRWWHPRSLGHRHRPLIRARHLERRMLAPVHPVAEPVVHALEADDLLPAGEGAREAQRVDHSFSAGVAEPHLLDAGHCGDDLASEPHLVRGWQREHRTPLGDGTHYRGGDA